MKVGVSGNTKQTYKGLQLLVSLGYEIVFIFGLPDEQLDGKVNSVNLTEFANQHNIPLYKTNNWEGDRKSRSNLTKCTRWCIFSLG